MTAVQTETYKGYEIRIHPDENAEDPRADEANLGTMVCFHGRYNLGDKADFKSENFSGWADMEKHLRAEHGAVIVLPLSLYDHSGLRMKVGSFNGLLPQGHAEFDSGQVGFIYTTRERILNAFWPDRPVHHYAKLTAKLLKKARKSLEVEVTVYDQFLSGDVYGYEVVKPAKCEACGHDDDVVESCWGFYGGGGAVAEARRVVDELLKALSKAEGAKAEKKGGKK